MSDDVGSVNSRWPSWCTQGTLLPGVHQDLSYRRLPKLEARAIVAFANLLVSGVWISELGEELLLTTRLASTRMYTVYLYIRSQYAA